MQRKEPKAKQECAPLPDDLPAPLALSEEPAEIQPQAQPPPQQEVVAAPQKRKKGAVALLFGEIGFYLVLLIVVVGIFFIQSDGAPKSIAGYSAFTVLTGSMQDVIPKGSLVVAKQVDDKELQIGDDITYLSGPTTTVTHRIVGITENYGDTGQRAFETKGVMNEKPDKLLVPAANVVGKVIFHSYGLGQAAEFLKQNWPLLLFFALLGIVLFKVLKATFRPEKAGKRPKYR